MATMLTAGTDAALAAFAADVRDGLGRGQKELPARYFYDPVGSALFEAICQLPEYGLSRAGERLFRANSEAIVARLDRPVRLIELGSGTARKTRHLVAALAARQAVTYHPIDISASALAESVRQIGQVARSEVVPFEGDYLDGTRAAARLRRPGEALLVLFLGSTIGNFRPAEQAGFLAALRALLAAGDHLFLSTDLVKPEPVLRLAYDDPAGVTAAFNKNLLARINRSLGADFDLARFRHEARWDGRRSRIEMHLVSTVRQRVRIPLADLAVDFDRGESIWTESSYKFELGGVRRLAGGAGFECIAQWVDEEWPFAQSLCRAV